jgi:hypothetical protein
VSLCQILVKLPPGGGISYLLGQWDGGVKLTIVGGNSWVRHFQVIQ